MNSPSRSNSPGSSSRPRDETPSSAPTFDPFATPDDAEIFETDAELDELDPLDEEIAAYLDGELDADARAAFERRLAEEPELRARVDEERSAWDALSLLDVDASNDRLT
ncbi:MAG: hypothetical protein IKU86_05740, partial [Thermoguttaceae bacterium]|nr:hypothetical protein [Thermoguttaceae bacterium]